MTLLNREAVLKVQDTVTKDIAVPEWGGSIRVRTMTVAVRNEFARRASSEDKVSVAAWLISVLSVDENGEPLFKAEDIPELERRNFRAVDRVVQAILEINGISEKKVEEAAKNSKPIQS